MDDHDDLRRRAAALTRDIAANDLAAAVARQADEAADLGIASCWYCSKTAERCDICRHLLPAYRAARERVGA